MMCTSVFHILQAHSEKQSSKRQETAVARHGTDLKCTIVCLSKVAKCFTMQQNTQGLCFSTTQMTNMVRGPNKPAEIQVSTIL